MKTLVAIFLLAAMPAIAAPLPDAKGRAGDIDWLIDQIGAHYAYLPERHLDLTKLHALYRHDAEAADTHDQFVHVIEAVIGELHDHHATLGTNTPTSPQLVPTGTDIWAEMKGGRAVITEVRLDSPAAKAGMRAGDVVASIGGMPTAKAVTRAMPRALTVPDAEAASFALRTLLAGNHRDDRRFVLADGRVINLPPYEPPQASTLLTRRWLKLGIGYIRIENSLGDSGLVAAFDDAIKPFANARALILDLRNTPSGGDSDVAEPVLGHFIDREAGYQRVFNPAPGKSFPKDSWVKPVKPRAPHFAGRLVVLSDHWTGSMGEGMTVGLDGLHRAVTVGTAMAGLSGGTGPFTLPHSGITVHFPIERLYHIDNTPREHWLPRITVDVARPGDAILAQGLREAQR